MGAAAPKAAAAAGIGFWSFLDGCLADNTGLGESPEPKRPMPAERNQNDGLAAPTSTPVQAVSTPPLAPRWGLEQSESLGAAMAAPAQEVTAVGSQDFSSDSGSAPEGTVLPQFARTAGPLAWDLALPPDDPASKTDPAKGPRDAAQALDAIPELAFGARLLPPAPVTPSSGAADALPSPPAAAAPASASPGAGPQDRSMPAEDEHTQPKNAEVSGTSLDAHTTPLDNRQSGSENIAITGNARSSSTTPEEGRSTPAPEQRNAGPLASIAAKCAAPSGEHPAGDRGENAHAGQPDMESAWNTAAPSPADGEAPSAVPAREASETRPAVVEPPEPAAQPVSRDVSLHLADGESSVDIRMAERAGEIRVTVHTPDRDLANSLRADLPDLVGKLRQSGFQAEVWRPAAATQSDAGRRSGSDAAPSQERSPGGRRDGRQRQPQQQQPEKQSRWAGAWKSSLDPAQESHL